MAVTFDNTAFASSSSAITLTTPAFVITSNPNVAGFAGLSTTTAISGSSASIGGVAGVQRASGLNGTTATRAFSVLAPPSGSQTGTASWTTASKCTLGIVTAYGVDQTTVVNNFNNANSASGNPSLAVTSTNGDLTVECTSAGTGTLSAPTQNSQWNDSASFCGAGSTGPGTGTTTHGWTLSAGNWSMAGFNFIQAAAVPDAIGSANITSSAGRFIGWTT